MSAIHRLPLTSPADVDKLLLERGARAAKCLTLLPPLDLNLVLNAPSYSFDVLRDELGPFAQNLSRDRRWECRSNAERATLEGVHWSSSRSPNDDFAAVLDSLNRSVAPDAGGRRRGDVRFGADAKGQVIFLPGVEHVSATISELIAAMQRQWPEPCRAAIAATLLLNAHPFQDGNGRTARILANLILREAGMQAGAYVPFSELAWRSGGGYEIALRRAEILGDWSGIILWFINAIEVYAGIVGVSPACAEGGPDLSRTGVTRPLAIR